MKESLHYFYECREVYDAQYTITNDFIMSKDQKRQCSTYTYTLTYNTILVPRICLRAKINHGDNRPRRNYVTNQDCQSINLRTKKITLPTNFCCFHAIISVLLARLLYPLGFYHCDVVLSEIVLINTGLLEWLDYFSQCNLWFISSYK